jgi:hypothetical protein
VLVLPPRTQTLLALAARLLLDQAQVLLALLELLELLLLVQLEPLLEVLPVLLVS